MNLHAPKKISRSENFILRYVNTSLNRRDDETEEHHVRSDDRSVVREKPNFSLVIEIMSEYRAATTPSRKGHHDDLERKWHPFDP
jgi:hypothetical protein